MSLYDYEISKQLEAMDVSFYGLIMAAMRRADTDNLNALRAFWPAVWDELQARYNAPGGALNDAEMEYVLAQLNEVEVAEDSGEPAPVRTFAPGEQIAYVPVHADGDLNHPDVEFGFVERLSYSDVYSCRYWRKGELGVLRTVTNGEATPAENLVSVWSVPQATVDAVIDRIREAKETER